MDIFWRTIAEYNADTWLYQVVIVVVGALLSISLIYKPTKWKGRVMKLYLAFIFGWITIVYYTLYSAPRGYSNILAIFWGLLTLTWIWDALTDYTKFAHNEKYKVLALILMATPLIYPLLSLARGLSFPSMTSPVMPCAVTTFTIGLLLYKTKKVNMFIVLFLCHWSLIGLIKTYFYNIPEDFLLVAVSIPAIYLFFKAYFLSDLPQQTKPEAKHIKGLLLGVCIAISLILALTFIQELRIYGMI